MHVEPTVRIFFHSSITVQVGNGRSTYFWTDAWLQGHSVQDIAPALFLLIGKRTRRNQTVAEALHDRNWIRSITGGLSVQAIGEYITLWHQLDGLELQHEVDDKIIWRWSADGQYSAKSAYAALHSGSTQLDGYALIWESWSPLKVKIFLRLSFLRRHWTADRRRRHGLDANLNCTLRDQEPESSDHLFIFCSFTRQVWWVILDALHAPLPASSADLSLQNWWRLLRRNWSGVNKKGFDTLFALVTWEIWKERNARVFRQASLTATQLAVIIRQQRDLWIDAGARKLRGLLRE